MVSQVQSMKPMSTSENVEGDFMMILWEILLSSRLEIMMFLSAVAGYLLIFASRVPKDVQRLKMKAKQFQYQEQDKEDSDATPRNFADVDASLSFALSKGDNKSVMKAWNSVKQFNEVPTAKLFQIVEAMQATKKDSQFIIRELKAFFGKHREQCTVEMINEILAVLGNRLDTEMMSAIVELLTSFELKKDDKTFEIFLSMYATTRSFSDVEATLIEMKENGVELSCKGSISVIKAAMQAGKFDDAFARLEGLKASWKAEGPDAAWVVPRHIMAQLAESACKEQKLKEFLAQLEDIPLHEEAINTMLSECVRIDDSDLAREVETLARAQGGSLADSTYALLIKSLAGRPWRMKAVIQEVLSREGSEVSIDLANTIMHVSAKSADKCVVDDLLEKMAPKQTSLLSSFIKFYIETEQNEKACDVFEQRVQPLNQSDGQKRCMIDSRVERSLMTAAVNCGRNHLVQNLFDTSKPDVAKHIVMIRKCASEKNLKGAMAIFNSLKESGVELNNIVYNTVLDACVKCHDLSAAEEWMKQTRAAGMVDVVSFNTLMKAHLADGNIDKARALMKDMRESGMEPNRVTYNELVSAVIAHGGRRSEIWEVVKQMKDAGVAPNQVTCSILLKSLNAKSPDTDIILTMDLIEAIDEPMDEVLLSSIVEACVRIGKPDLVASKLKFLEGKQKIIANSSHTCGSLIKAYGYARDIEGVWRCWKEMRSKMVKPTSITLGCMVEAVVNNGDTEGAFELLHQMQKEGCAELVNSVIYCSVLKGFAREKQLDRVWDVYQEMCEKKMELSLIAFNSLIDACARAGRMEQLPRIMEDMKKCYVDPNIVTYSTILKGHCTAGEMEQAFALLRKMKKETKLKPDEIMYNSLLDGCNRNNLFEEGLELLEEMLREGITPSNFTLSIVVRLLARARKVEKAFELVQEVTKKYNFRPNVHVYTNLIQACTSSRQHARALTVLEDMVRDRVQPDGRLYAILIRGLIYGDKMAEAAKLLRSELGLPGSLEVAGLRAARDWDQAAINEALSMLPQNLSSPLIEDIKNSKLRIKIDATPRDFRVSSKGKGKGKGSRSSW